MSTSNKLRGTLGWGEGKGGSHHELSMRLLMSSAIFITDDLVQIANDQMLNPTIMAKSRPNIIFAGAWDINV